MTGIRTKSRYLHLSPSDINTNIPLIAIVFIFKSFCMTPPREVLNLNYTSCTPKIHCSQYWRGSARKHFMLCFRYFDLKLDF